MIVRLMSLDVNSPLCKTSIECHSSIEGSFYNINTTKGSIAMISNLKAVDKGIRYDILCDKCGEVVESYTITPRNMFDKSETEYNTLWNQRNNVDLCSKCAEEEECE